MRLALRPHNDLSTEAPRRPHPWIRLGLMAALLALALWPAWSADNPPPGGSAAEAGGQPAPQPYKYPENLWELIVAGGIVMIPIGLFSVWAMAVSIERLFTLRRHRIIPPNFIAGLAAAFGPDGTNIQGALAYCDRTASPLSNTIRAGILKLGRRIEIVEKAIEDAAAGEVARMRRGIESLAVVGTLSPLLGLLGTVVGMINAFRTAALFGLGRGELLATGIHIALVTTAGGLTVAIPALVAYNYFLGRVERLADEMEHVCGEFLDQCYEEPVTAQGESSNGEERRRQWADSPAGARAAGRP